MCIGECGTKCVAGGGGVDRFDLRSLDVGG